METLERPAFIPIEGNSAIDYLLGILCDAHVTTLQRLENINQEEFDWVYAAGWNSAGALVAHITSVKHLFRAKVVEQRPWTRDEGTLWLPGLELGTHVSSLRGIPFEIQIEAMADAHALLLNAVRKMSPEDFVRERSDPKGFGRYNAAWALYHAAEDEVHHRGQISILRKLYAQATAAR